MLLEGQWLLCFSPEGKGFLVPDAGETAESCWVNTLFKRSVHDDMGSTIIFDRELRTKCAVEDLASEMSLQVFRHSWNHIEFHSEVYDFEIPKGALNNKIFWAVPWVQNAVWGNDTHNRWVCRNCKTWLRWLESLGFDNAEVHIRFSTKSLVAQAKARSGEVSARMLLSGEQEYSISNICLLAMLAGWGANALMRSCGDSMANASRLLSVLVDAFVGEWTFVFRTPAGIQLKLVSGIVDRVHLLEVVPTLRRRLGHATDGIPIADLLLQLMSIFKCTRASAAVGESTLTDLLQGLLLMLHHNIESSRDLPCWVEAGHSGLPVLRLQTARPRRISIGKKQSISLEVVASPQLKRASQLLAAETAIALRDGAAPPVNPKSVGRFSRTNMFQYWLASRGLFAKPTHISLCCDGGRVAGEELELMALFSTAAMKGCWAAPQVLHFQTCSSEFPKCTFGIPRTDFRVRLFGDVKPFSGCF